jgi:hypothetical protein
MLGDDEIHQQHVLAGPGRDPHVAASSRLATVVSLD